MADAIDLAPDLAVTRNSCVVCAPLGATIAFAGVRGGMTILHGSQGCATYIRRYTISHFREPLDAASSSFTEESAVFGGKVNLRKAFENVVREYQPEFVGVATTCLAETIGEDASSARSALRDLALAPGAPLLATVSTPSYRGDQRAGFRLALRAIVEAACPCDGAQGRRASAGARDPVAVFPSMLSTSDLRSLKEISAAFGLDAVLVSDYSDTLDGGPWKGERLLPSGGTPVADLRRLSSARYAIELCASSEDRGAPSGADYLAERFGAERIRLGLPVGVEASDALMAALSRVSGRPVPRRFEEERARLLDSYVDCHKILFGRRALLYGDLDLRAAVAGFCAELGIECVVAEGEGRDFASVEAAADRSIEAGRPIDLLIGSSKGYKTAKRIGATLVRVGFPIHDRFGGQRVRLLSYAGTQDLLDRVVNAIIERKQEDSDVGYTYY